MYCLCTFYSLKLTMDKSVQPYPTKTNSLSRIWGCVFPQINNIITKVSHNNCAIHGQSSSNKSPYHGWKSSVFRQMFLKHNKQKAGSLSRNDQKAVEETKNLFHLFFSTFTQNISWCQVQAQAFLGTKKHHLRNAIGPYFHQQDHQAHCFGESNCYLGNQIECVWFSLFYPPINLFGTDKTQGEAYKQRSNRSVYYEYFSVKRWFKVVIIKQTP